MRVDSVIQDTIKGYAKELETNCVAGKATPK